MLCHSVWYVQANGESGGGDRCNDQLTPARLLGLMIFKKKLGEPSSSQIKSKSRQSIDSNNMGEGGGGGMGVCAKKTNYGHRTPRKPKMMLNLEA